MPAGWISQAPTGARSNLGAALERPSGTDLLAATFWLSESGGRLVLEVPQATRAAELDSKLGSGAWAPLDLVTQEPRLVIREGEDVWLDAALDDLRKAARETLPPVFG